ncbi:MAG: Ca-activated chloride channel family protein [Saprospiraceae bacterium]|jgi:Ca-activated chloride channel family protein
MAQPETSNHDQIRSVLKNINPIGRTPLAAAALKVIDQIKNSNNAATIILVSDRAKPCGGNLCTVVKAAKEAGIDFVLHIVGFDIGESDKLAL